MARTRRMSASTTLKSVVLRMAVALSLVAVIGFQTAQLSHQAPDRPRGPAVYELLTSTDGPLTQLNAAFIGDSYTMGARASAPDKRWTTLVSQKMGWIEHNFGRGGTGYVSTSSGHQCSVDSCPNYSGMLDAVAASSPDIVVVAGGQNDMAEFKRDSGLVFGAITSTYRQLRDRLPTARIIAVGPTYPGDVTPSLIAFDHDVRDAARAVGADFVSLIAPTPVLRQDMLSTDHWHVGDAGHLAIADRVASVLAPTNGMLGELPPPK